MFLHFRGWHVDTIMIFNIYIFNTANTQETVGQTIQTPQSKEFNYFKSTHFLAKWLA